MRQMRLKYQTKRPEDLIAYVVNGVRMLLPKVFIYMIDSGADRADCDPASALETFRAKLRSCIVGRMGKYYVAFPAKGLFRISRSLEQILYRIEDGKVSETANICMLCDYRVRQALSGCITCEGTMAKMSQLNPMVVVKSKNTEDRDLKKGEVL